VFADQFMERIESEFLEYLLNTRKPELLLIDEFLLLG